MSRLYRGLLSEFLEGLTSPWGLKSPPPVPSVLEVSDSCPFHVCFVVPVSSLLLGCEVLER